MKAETMSKEEIETLKQLIKNCQTNKPRDRMEAWDRLRDFCGDYAEELLELNCEVARLKSGKFTPEEFQNLCHNYSEDDYEKFCDGCDDWQKKLFGKCRSETTEQSFISMLAESSTRHIKSKGKKTK